MARKLDFSKLRDWKRQRSEFIPGPYTSHGVNRRISPQERARLRFLAYMAAPKEQNEKT
jgi:hypothetical protein